MTTDNRKSLTPASRSAEPHREQKTIGWFQMPTGLLDEIPQEHRDEVFILGLDGNCLKPLAHHNDHAMVAPRMPVCVGDLVVLWPKNPEQRPLIKRLVLAPPHDWAKWSPVGECVPMIIVEQLNPPRRYHITTDKLSAIHRVVATFSPGDCEHTVIEPPQRPLRRAGGAA